MAVFREDCRERLQLHASIKKGSSRRGLGVRKGKKLRLMYKARVLKNHPLGSINETLTSPTKCMCRYPHLQRDTLE